MGVDLFERKEGEMGEREMSHEDYRKVVTRLYPNGVRKLEPKEGIELAAAVEKHLPNTCDECLGRKSRDRKKNRKRKKFSWVERETSEMS